LGVWLTISSYWYTLWSLLLLDWSLLGTVVNLTLNLTLAALDVDLAV
jgi:hypothetical protein